MVWIDPNEEAWPITERHLKVYKSRGPHSISSIPKSIIVIDSLLSPFKFSKIVLIILEFFFGSLKNNIIEFLVRKSKISVVLYEVLWRNVVSWETNAQVLIRTCVGDEIRLRGVCLMHNRVVERFKSHGIKETNNIFFPHILHKNSGNGKQQLNISKSLKA